MKTGISLHFRNKQQGTGNYQWGITTSMWFHGWPLLGTNKGFFCHLALYFNIMYHASTKRSHFGQSCRGWKEVVLEKTNMQMAVMLKRMMWSYIPALTLKHKSVLERTNSYNTTITLTNYKGSKWCSLRRSFTSLSELNPADTSGWLECYADEQIRLSN